jgi:hypothetical protein
MQIINGKQVNLPNSITPDEIVRQSGFHGDPNSRAVVVTSTGKNTRLKPGQQYTPKEGDKFKVVPDRVKGSGSYFGVKKDWQKQVIREQVVDMSAKFFKSMPVELDDNCNWVVFDGFLLPPAWKRANPGKDFVKMMLIFPDEYPDLPTNGFYLSSSLNVPQHSGHFFTRGYGGAFGEDSADAKAMADKNWMWYCTHIKPGSWQPAKIHKISDWRKGDNLWDIITLCTEVLTHPMED